MSISLIYVTFASQENARDVAKDLVKEQLISCANIFPAVQSIYQWEGQLQEESEIVGIFKTKTELFKQVEERIKTLHSYEVPCIIALGVENADKSFTNWVENQVCKVL